LVRWREGASYVFTAGLVIVENFRRPGPGTGGGPHLIDAVGPLHEKKGHGSRSCLKGWSELRRARRNGRWSAAVARPVQQRIERVHEARREQRWVHADE